MRRHLAATTTALALTLAVTGCGLGDDEGGDPGTSTTSGASTPASSPSSPSGSTDTGSSDLDQAAQDAGIDPTSPPSAISSVTMPGHTADDEVELTVDLFGLKRAGDLLVLTVGITPDAEAEGNPRSFLGWTGSTWSPQLVDTANLKVHNVVRADGDLVSTSTGAASTSFGAGQTFYLYAVFAAPPKDVMTMTVKPADGAPAITGVKIQ